MADVKCLTLGEAKQAYLSVLGGRTVPIRDLNGLEYALDAPGMGFGNSLSYPTIHEQGAVLCFKIIAGHVFSDGCKRGGNAILLRFLATNGYRLDATKHEQMELMKLIGKSLLTQEQLASFLEPRIHMNQ